MDYSIYKDDNVSSTINRIRKIFNNVGIEVEEHYSGFEKTSEFMPHSLRIDLFGINEIGSNGKGTTRENCRASAYSEFMERLENQSLPKEQLRLKSNKFYFAPDEKIYDPQRDEYVKKYKKEELISILLPNKVFIPYFNVKSNKIDYLPALTDYYGSNGMAAGNTPEEALVQGFSEVCERYAYKQVIIDNISMPDIPPKYYNKYDNINHLIKYAKENGWEVQFKDASLGQGLPVVCAVYKNKSNGYYTYNFGSQPSLPVAIERTLTEFFQGGSRKLKNLNTIDIQGYTKEELKQVFPAFTIENVFFKSSNKLYNTFYKNKAKYNFSENSWIKQNRTYTNKELLKFLVNSIKRITNNDIYVRDVSFLNFPAYHIFIPEVSDDVYFDRKRLNMHKWLLYNGENINASYNIDSLISAILFKFKFQLNGWHFAENIPDEYILLLCYMIKDDITNILKCCNAIIKNPNSKFMTENQNLIDIIFHYYNLKQQNERKTIIKNIINNLYTEKDVRKFNNLIDNLNFEYITNIIIESKEKAPKEINDQIQKNLNNKINEIIKKLIEKYIENTPNQMDLAKVFDFSDLEEY